MRCDALGGLVAGEVLIDPVTCLRCVCEPDGTATCLAQPSCQPPDGAPPPPAEDLGPDRSVGGAVDASPERCAVALNRCLDPVTALRCRPDGTWAEIACEGVERCVIDRCARPACPPGELFCAGGVRRRCDPTGFGASPEPCAEDLVCAEARCVDPQANVVLVVDTSGSMLDPVRPAEPVAFPVCEPPEAPYTRLGLVKHALAALFESAEAARLRLALQRFPQTTRELGICGPGHYQALETLPGHAEQPRLTAAELAAAQDHILAVPFTADGSFPAAELARWVDFDEVYGVLSETCVGCPADGLCVGGRCLGHLEPELRAQGATPLGRSLFYAGEYLRHAVLREGLACAEDADCGSPHYGCEAGRCHDPLWDCRPLVVILFTDGGESVDREADDLFNPGVQARRLNLGLDCVDARGCFAPADCVEGRCVTGRCAGDPGRGCLDDAGCGTDLPCVPAERPPEGRFPEADRLRHPGGQPARVTVHVVDAVGGFAANRRAAFWGGGLYQRVERFSVEELVAALTPLLETKAVLDRCLGR